MHNLGEGLLYFAVFPVGVFAAPEHIRFGALAAADAHLWHTAGRVLSVLYSMNVLLMAFNLLPVPPLDGSAVLALGFAPETARCYHGFRRRTPVLGWIGLFAAWQAFGFIFAPIFTAAVSLLYPGVSYD